MSAYDQVVKDAREAGKPGRAVELAEGVYLPFCEIPACPDGFWMGTRGGEDHEEEPRHRVILSQPFLLGAFPVTQEQFAVFRPQHESFNKGRPQNPVEQVSWDDALAFCSWLAVTLQGKALIEKYSARWGPVRFGLPTEAQWEYACRADTDTDYCYGDGDAALDRVGWYHENSGGESHPVGEKVANDFGLYDMHGNVWEWCRDGWEETAYRSRGHGAGDPLVDPHGRTASCAAARGTTRPGAAAPRIASGTGPATASGTAVFASVCFPVRPASRGRSPIRKRRRREGPGGGGTP